MEKSWKINVEKEGHPAFREETEVRGGMWLTKIHLDKCACVVVCVWLGG